MVVMGIFVAVMITMWIVLMVLKPDLAGASPRPQRMSCPRSDRRSPKSTGTRAARQLVPPGVTRVLLCRYHGTKPAKAFAVADTLAVRKRSTVMRLSRQFDDLGVLSPPKGCYGFPGYDTRLIAFFYYRSQPTDPVVFDLDTCGGRVSNGQLVRSWGPSAGYKLENELLAMTNCVPPQEPGDPICR